jgi:hypothetical protein
MWDGGWAIKDAMGTFHGKFPGKINIEQSVKNYLLLCMFYLYFQAKEEEKTGGKSFIARKLCAAKRRRREKSVGDKNVENPINHILPGAYVYLEAWERDEEKAETVSNVGFNVLLCDKI